MLLRLIVGLAVLCVVSMSGAQSFPSKLLRIISPYPPGRQRHAGAHDRAQALRESSPTGDRR